MGGSKQTQNSNSQTSTTTQLPAWMTQAGQDLYTKASAQPALGAYNGQMSAGQTGNQVQASKVAAGATGAWQPDLSAARSMTTAAAGAPAPTMTAATQGAYGYQAAGNGQAPSVSANSVSTQAFGTPQAEQYMNPWQRIVQANTLAQMNRQNEIDHANLNDNVQASKAFGGTRGALLESEQAKNQAQTKSDYIDKSNADAFSAAQAQFNADRAAKQAADTGNADRSLQAGTTNASLLDQLMGRIDTANQFNAGAQNTAAGANADRSQDAAKTNVASTQSMLDRLMAGGSQMGNIATANSNLSTQDVSRLASTGATEQGTNQDALDRTYQDWLRAGNAPLDNIKDIMAILSGAPRNVTTNGTSSGTSVTKSDPGLFNQILGVAQVAASAFSDPRLKRDVHLIERLKSGLGIYRFRYLWEPRRSIPHIGVMADEVARIIPEALGPIVGGFMTVNYAKLGGAL